MADIIELAAFDFDSDRLEKGIEELQKQLFELTKRQQELNKQTRETNSALDAQNKEADRLVKNFKNGSQEYQKAVQEQAKLKKAGQENTQAYKDLNTEKQRLTSTFKAENAEYQQVTQNVTQLTNKQEGLFLSTKDLQIQRSALNKEYQTATTLYKQFIGVNGEVLSLQDVINKSVKQEATTRQEAKQANIQLNKIKDQLNLTNENELQLLNEINKRIDANNELLKESGSQNEKRVANIGMYSESIQEAAGNLDVFNGGLTGFIQRSIEAGGAGTLVTNSFNQMKTGIIGLTRASFAFAATPIGAIVTILSTIVLIGRELFKYNTEAEKTERLIRGITKTAGEETAKIRLMGEAIQEVFGSDLEETVQTAKVLVNEFGITYEEALNQIREGLIRGQESNKQYLDSLREYSTFFAQAGYSVEEFRSIVSAGYDLGIYTDKLPDAIKEFSISINEQTKATRDALVNAFGTEFTDNLLKRVREGKTGVNQALKEISEQAEKSNLDLQQQAQLTADVFRGAGEDAGGALKIFDAVNKAYSDQTRELTELEKATKEYADAVEELGVAKDEALNSESIISFKKEFNLLWTQAKTDFYNFVKFVTDEINFLNTLFKAFYRTAFTIIGQIQTAINNFDITSPIESLKSLGNIDITKTFSKNLDSIREQQKELKKLDDAQRKSAENAQANAGQIEARRKAQEEAAKKAEELARKAAEAESKRMDLLIATQKNVLELWIAQQGDRARTLQEQLTLEQQTSEKSKAILDSELKAKKITQEKYDLEVLKMQQSAAKLQAQIAEQAAKQELDTYIYENQSRLKQGQLLTDDLLQQEIDRNEAIQRERDAFTKLQFDQGLINDTEYQNALLQNQREFLEQERTLKEKNADDQREINNLRLAEEGKERLLRLEEDNASEFAIGREKAQQEYTAQKLELEQQLADGLITQENYQLALDNISQTHAQVRKQIAELEETQKQNLAKETFSGIAEAVGEQTALGKAAGIATASINTYQGISEVWKSPAVFPEPYNTILKVIQSGITLASGLKTVKQITSVKTPSVKGYATGGKISGGFPIKRSNGDNRLITAKDGEAILTEKQQMFIGRDLLSLAGVPGFATGGVVGGASAASLSTVQNNILQSQPMFDMDNFMTRVETAVQNGSQTGSQQGTAIGSQQGISQLSSNRAVQVGSMD